jgi:hypothetical protein
MKIKILTITLVAVLQVTSAFANEGMWLISLLNRITEAEMKGLGLQLTKEEIYSINNASLKDAIARLNYGSCTGELVSPNGLIFTNHHCGYDAIQSLSTLEDNILTNGFCAKSFAEERPIPGFKISFLVRIDDITTEMLSVVQPGMTEQEREKAIMQKSKELQKTHGEDGKYDVDVKSFFYGNEYYMMIYRTFSDIRLVGAPPESVGKFGGDTDNWMWPRHTGDFSMLRVYANSDNQPAEYSNQNVPYKPAHFLPVNIDGVKEGDFTMIMGFPGRTSRYLTSFGVDQSVEKRNPALIECLGTKLESWKEIMDKDERVRLMYAAKYASTANGWKYYIGQNKGLKRLEVSKDKEQIESQFNEWLLKNPKMREKYSEALPQVKSYYEEWEPYVTASTYSGLAGLGGAELIGFVASISSGIEAALNEKDKTVQKTALLELLPEAEVFFNEYSMEADKLTFIRLTNLHRARIAADLPSWHEMIEKKFKGDVTAFANQLYKTSVFADRNKFMAFLDKPSLKRYQADMAAIVAKSASEHAMALRSKNPMSKLSAGMRLFVAGLREMNPDKAYAPDANSTLRLTYGVIDDYKAADAVHYDYYTTTDGIMEKRDNTNPEFVVPDKLADLIRKKDFGRYADKDGKLVTCFIHNLDITGGNSGSPVIDGRGNLVGIAFDGNWEAMSGDIAFEPAMQRTISVDIRYVLFTIEKLMDGKNIIDELKFTSKK